MLCLMKTGMEGDERERKEKVPDDGQYKNRWKVRDHKRIGSRHRPVERVQQELPATLLPNTLDYY